MESSFKDLEAGLRKLLSTSQQRCAICDAVVLESKRYPSYLCDSCVEEAVDKDHNRVSFTDEIDGHSVNMCYVEGHLPNVISNPARGDAYPHVWVRGVECEVRVAHFGGIVMTPVV